MYFKQDWCVDLINVDQDRTQLRGSREYNNEISGFIQAGKLLIIYSTTPLIRKLVVRTANYPD